MIRCNTAAVLAALLVAGQTLGQSAAKILDEPPPPPRPETPAVSPMAPTVPAGEASPELAGLWHAGGPADAGAGDWKLWAAMALQGKIAYLGEPLNYHRSHGASVRSKSLQGRLGVAETLRVIRWILGQVTHTEDAREKLCQTLSGLWVPAVVTMHVPLGRRWAILRNARAIDPHAIRRVAGPAFVALRRKILKHCRFVQPGT